MNELIMCKRGAWRVDESGLFITQAISEDDFRELPTGKDLVVRAHGARSPEQLAKAWVLAQKIADATWLHDKYDAMEWLKYKAHHFKWITDPTTGECVAKTKSIAFESLSQELFNRIFNRYVYVTCSEIIPGLDNTALRKSVEEMVNGSTAND